MIIIYLKKFINVPEFAVCTMLDRQDISVLKKDMADSDKEREEVIIASRNILKLSKSAIYSLHKGQDPDLGKIKTLIQGLKGDVGAFSAAKQEYVEALAFKGYLEGQIPPKSSLGFEISARDYLLGLCDLTGELARRAVLVAIEKKQDEVKNIRDTVSEIMELFLDLDLRNGELRKKSDAIKWNLKKIEEILYDLSR